MKIGSIRRKALLISRICRISPLRRKALLIGRIRRVFRRFLVLLLILLFALPIYLFIFNRSASAAWFDENWAYRQAIPVTSTYGSAQTVYIRLAENLSFQAEDESRRIHTSTASLIKLRENSGFKAGEIYTESGYV